MNSSIPYSYYPILYPPVTTLPSDYPSFAETAWKKATLAVLLIILISGWLVFFTAVRNRTYPALKAKQLPVLAVALISIHFFSLGQLVTYQIVDQVGIFSDCNLWLMWSSGVFGLNLYLLAASFRCQRLYFIIVLLNQFPKPYIFYGPLVLIYLPIIICCIFTSLLPWAWFTLSLHGLYISYSTVVLQVGYCFFLQFKISKIRKAFNEYREMRWVLLSISSACIFVLAMNLLGLSDSIPVKIAFAIFPAAISLNAVLLPLYGPCYGVLFNRDAHHQRRVLGMRDKIAGLPTNDITPVSKFTTTTTGAPPVKSSQL